MKFLDDIRNQSRHVRETMFYLSVLITVLLIGTVWFRSFQNNLYVLMNPEDDFTKSLAIETGPVPSLFGNVWQSVGNLKSLFSDILVNDNVSDFDLSKEKTEIPDENVYILPLSEEK